LSVQVRTAEKAEKADTAEIANQQTEELGHGTEFDWQTRSQPILRWRRTI
jgi:hypothetical protein